MTTDTKLKELIINKLTTSQYDSIEEKDPNQIYIVTDAPGFDNTITNCLTNVPQDIKYEIANNKFVLKAGSTLYEPSGPGNFIKHTTTQDYSWAWGTGQYIVLPQKSGNMGQSTSLAKSYSGTTAPSSPSGGYVWYDTTNNVIKRYDTTNGWVSANFCLPIAIVTNSDGVITSIDQIFNGLGYIGSTVFALPGVKGLIPNGRNADGSLKNIEFITNSVLIHTRTLNYNNFTITITSSTIGSGIYSYNEEENIVYTTYGANASICFCGSCLWNSSGQITSFKSKLPFKAADDQDVPKLNGKNTFNGENTFVGGFHLKAPNASGKEGAEVNWGLAETSVLRTGVKQDVYENSMRFFSQNSNGETVNILNLDFEVGYATTKIPPASDNSARIATTSWVNTKTPVGMILPFGGSSAPSGFLLCNGSAVSRTTYKALFNAIGTTYGTGDGSSTFNLPNLSSARMVTSATVGVKGTGKTLGMTDGTNNYGIGQRGYTGVDYKHMLAQNEIYNSNVNTTGSDFQGDGNDGIILGVVQNTSTSGLTGTASLATATRFIIKY